MKLTTCQLPDDTDQLADVWVALVAHVREHGSELVLLPEMPFYPWPCAAACFDAAVWEASLTAHEAWLSRLVELGEVTVAATRPVTIGARRLNEAFLWDSRDGYRAVHHKRYLPDEPEFWEASWYARGGGRFETAESPAGAVGFLVCTEIWFAEHARAYGRAGARLILCPRATKAETREKWLIGGRAAAIAAGAWCISANRGGDDWAGCGWIIEPESGDVVATTHDSAPFVTIDIELAAASRARKTYPRYVVT